MRAGCFLFLLVVFVAVSISPAMAQRARFDRWTGNFNLLFGAKRLDKGDWRPNHTQPEGSFHIDWGRDNWPVNIAFDWLSAEDNEVRFLRINGGELVPVELEGATQELHVGIRKIWDRFYRFRPFVGIGPAYVQGRQEPFSLRRGIFVDFEGPNSDWGWGAWGEAGAYWTFNRAFNAGVRGMYSWAELNMLNTTIQAGGWHAGLIVGYHWE